MGGRVQPTVVGAQPPKLPGGVVVVVVVMVVVVVVVVPTKLDPKHSGVVPLTDGVVPLTLHHPNKEPILRVTKQVVRLLSRQILQLCKGILKMWEQQVLGLGSPEAQRGSTVSRGQHSLAQMGKQQIIAPGLRLQGKGFQQDLVREMLRNDTWNNNYKVSEKHYYRT